MNSKELVDINNLPKDINVFDVKNFEDERGYLRCLFESSNQISPLSLNALKISYSKKNVARGLHWQKLSNPQSKLVTVLSGKILDILVNLDKSSENFGHVYKFILESGMKKMVLVPANYAHGFLALENTLFLYACSGAYNENAEISISLTDYISKFVNATELIQSKKDKLAVPLTHAKKII